MDSAYLNQLPGQIKELVSKIETYGGREIIVAVDTRPVSPTDPNQDRLAAEVSEHSATIFLRDAKMFPAHSVLHELLHIERYWNEQVPQIEPRPPGDENKWSVTSAIENNLEHLVIVPREAQYGFEPFSYWTETTRKNWETYPWPHVPNPWARRKNCMLGWLTTVTLTNDDTLKAMVADCIRKEGLFGEVKAFETKIKRQLASKVSMLGTVVRFLDIPYNDARAVTMDVRAGRRVERTIPRY